MNRYRNRGLLWAICSVWMGVAAGIGCTSNRVYWPGDGEIVAVLKDQQASWNNGDIEAFMEPYLHSPDLSFSSGGKLTRGWKQTLSGYKERYPTRDAMGHLTFDELEVTRLASDAALVLGRWHLDRQEPIGGAFSLVLRKNGGRWEIIHDHTSKDAP